MRNSYLPLDHAVLSRTAEYALRALLVLVRRGGEGPISADVIAEATGAPTNYLRKTLYSLGKEGLVRGSRGPTGGFVLAVSPDLVTIADVAAVFAEPIAASRCLLGTGPCDASHACAAHAAWRRVVGAAHEPLRSTTLAALLGHAGQTTVSPLTTSAGQGRAF